MIIQFFISIDFYISNDYENSDKNFVILNIIKTLDEKVVFEVTSVFNIFVIVIVVILVIKIIINSGWVLVSLPVLLLPLSLPKCCTNTSSYPPSNCKHLSRFHLPDC